MANLPNETDGLITIPLKDLLLIVLGTEISGHPCNYIPESTARLLELSLKDSQVYKVDFDSSPPRLWWYRDWKTAQDTRNRQRAWAESERIRRWIFSANVETVARAIMKKTKVPESMAQSMAYSLMMNPNARIVIGEFFGVKQLKEKESDL